MSYKTIFRLVLLEAAIAGTVGASLYAFNSVENTILERKLDSYRAQGVTYHAPSGAISKKTLDLLLHQP